MLRRPRIAPTWRARSARLPRAPPFRAQSNDARPASRLDRLASRLPRRLRPYTARLRSAPVSHVVAFLVLHELTAVVPLLGLFALFHYSSHAPVAYMTEHFGEGVEAGVARFERYFRRKGWFGFGGGEGQEGETPSQTHDAHDARDTRTHTHTHTQTHAHAQDAVRLSDGGERKYRILVEVALAYAATKALLPVRVVVSVWATPWFAGVLARMRASLTGK
ncbi:Uncharacterized protein ESCO_006025 [Escovopsis weberi]|uniref:Uncharacterized protein n=1 Tax=Escovopsis weberi TaxID=150374 RepID=A0A0M8MZW9_ESCWE|nr:Uncharacterized protein ESCO_006025 [Escovopsis weberi]